MDRVIAETLAWLGADREAAMSGGMLDEPVRCHSCCAPLPPPRRVVRQCDVDAGGGARP
jgi:hypothetical protein